jgi:hypothetical protein
MASQFLIGLLYESEDKGIRNRELQQKHPQPQPQRQEPKIWATNSGSLGVPKNVWVLGLLCFCHFYTKAATEPL